MRWNIKGADADTGEEIEFGVDAEDAVTASRLANERNG
jgi:hypothetical protein